MLVGLTAFVPYSPLELKEETGVAAARADDAPVDYSTWATEGETPEVAKARETLRKLAVLWWAICVERGGRRWLEEHPNHTEEDVKLIEECIWKARAASYWSWHRGSRIMWWRMPEEWWGDFRDGEKFWHVSDLPKGMTRNAPSPSREAELRIREKVFQLWYRRYFENGFADLVVGRFAVMKSIDDIRAVWNGKSNGHNATLWTPGMMMPTFGDIENLVIKWLVLTVAAYLAHGSPIVDYTQDVSTYTKTLHGDIDVGQAFLNHQVHKSERHSLGVRVIETRNDGSYERHRIMRWCTLYFGGKCSPYLANKAQARILECCEGRPDDPTNPFQWDRVILNLPGQKEPDRDPSLPRVMRVRKDGELATAEETFVDDIHLVGRDTATEARTWEACKKLKSEIMNHRGNQADDRKFRKPTTMPGPWNGGLLHTDTPFPMKSTTGKKWRRFRDGLNWIMEQGVEGDEIDTAELQRIAGLGVNVCVC